MLKLREERLKRRWSQTRVSALTDIASPDISAVERGVKPAFPGWRRRLAVVFGLPEAYLFGPITEAQPKRARAQKN